MDGRPRFRFCAVSAEQGLRGLPQRSGLSCRRSEVLLERQAGLHRICADSCEFREALHNGVCCAVERREARNTRNIAVSHSGGVIGLTREQRNLSQPWRLPASADTYRQTASKTVPAPMEASKRSERPFWPQTSRRERFSANASSSDLFSRQAGTALR